MYFANEFLKVEVLDMVIPLISIIIPVYNVEKYLDDCMRCVCKQSYENLEIILVDDGSKDSSGALCDEWAKKDRRIKVIHKENGGLSDARNAGIAVASGQYIMFIDSDDLVAENIVEHLYKCIIDSQAQIAICDPVHLRPGEKADYKEQSCTKIYSTEDALCEMMYQTSFLFSAWGKLYDCALFEDIRFPVGLLFEDVAIMYKLFARCNTIVYSDAKLYGYLHRENSITTTKFSRRDCDILAICEDQVKFAKGYSEKVYQAAIAYQVVGALRVYLNAPSAEFSNEIELCDKIINTNLLKVLFNNKCRNKLRISLVLFKINKSLMRKIYSHVDRWK